MGVKMDEEFKIYRISKFFMIFVILFFSLWFLKDFEHYFDREGDPLWITIVDILVKFIWLIMMLYIYYKPPIITYENKIILRRYFFISPIIIETNKIISIERKSLTHIKIFYKDHNDKIKKQRIWIKAVEGDDQIKFNNFIEKVISLIPPSVLNQRSSPLAGS